MPEFPPQHIAVLKKFSAEVLFTAHGPSFTVDGHNIKQVSEGGSTCHVVDKATGKVYISVAGISESDSLAKAIDLIPITEKPLTAAQAETVRMVGNAVASKDAKIAELEAKIAAYETKQKKTTQPASV
jgi:uncharacterized protein YciI